MTAQQTPKTFPMCTKCANGRDHLKQIAVITHWTRCTLCGKHHRRNQVINRAHA